MEPMIVGQKFQNAADAAFARKIWWEAFKIVLEKDNIQAKNHDSFVAVADYAACMFIKHCESGFFDVKRETTP